MENPYAYVAAQETEDLADSAPRTTISETLVLAGWPILLALNLVVPLFLGWSLSKEHGRWGMAVAILCYLLAGWAVLLRLPRLRSPVLCGAALTALSQFLPLLQMFSGLIALGIAEQLGMVQRGVYGPQGLTSELSGFVVTLLVGGLLLSAVGLFALLYLLIGYAWRQGRNKVDRLRLNEPNAVHS